MIKHLIIKSSFSSLKNGQLKSNLGDLVRSTVLLNCINSEVHWLTDRRSINILRRFMDMGKLIAFEDGFEHDKLSGETQIYNLDNYIFDNETYRKLRGKWHGFVLNGPGEVVPANEFIRLTEPYTSSPIGLSWQEALVRGLGFNWTNQEYAGIAYPKNADIDIGLNFDVGAGWTSKRWPMDNWEKLFDILSINKSVSWQRGLNDIDEYMDWISSCKVIVTCDTLGMHLAAALRKNVVAIVGPTESRDFPYDRVFCIRPNPRKCMPCNLPICKMERHCLSEIGVETVSDIVSGLLDENTKSCTVRL